MAPGMTVGAALLLPAITGAPDVALAWIVVAMIVFGFSSGAWDIGIFTLRQRRTEPAMVGRAFTISMALNQSGYPIGAALAGWLAVASLDGALLIGVVFSVVGTALGIALVPREASDAAA